MSRTRSTMTASVVCLFALSACSNVVNGTQAAPGSVPAHSRTAPTPAPSSRSSSPDFPSASATADPSPSPTSPSAPRSSASRPTTAPTKINATRCPSVHYPQARLTFTCIRPSLKQTLADPIWPLAEYQHVDKAGWSMSQGAGAAKRGSTVRVGSLVNSITRDMVAGSTYGLGATSKTLSVKSMKVDGKTAALRETSVTLNVQYAKSFGTKVRHEHLWVLAIRVSKTAVSLWFVSIPDLAKKYWRTVPKLIKSIKVG